MGGAAPSGVPGSADRAQPGLADRLLRVRDRRRGIWRICAVIDYATTYCLAATVTPTSRGADALACLHLAVAEATRLTGLEDLRDDRGRMDILGPDDVVLGQVPAPIAVVSDNGPCFRGEVFAGAFTAGAFTANNIDDPLLRHVRTRVRSPQSNGVIERSSAP